MTKKIVVTQPIAKSVESFLQEIGDVFVHPGPENLPAKKLHQICRDADAVMVFMTEQIDRAFLDACPQLKIVAGALKGYDNIDVDSCSERGITVTVVPDLLSAPTAELALGLTIAVCRNMRAGDAHMRSGTFAGWRPKLFGGSISGSTIGVIGAGSVGKAFLSLLRGFDCTRLYYDRSALSSEHEQVFSARYADIAPLTESADIVVLALPLTAQTHHLVDANFLARMKPGSYLVNPARGSLVDEAAVSAALQSGHLAGYAADVFESEDWARTDRPPHVNPGLISAANTYLTPHLGSAVTEVRVAIEQAAADSIAVTLQGRLPPTAINTGRAAGAVQA